MARRLLTGAAVSGAVLAFSALAAHAEHFQATFSGFQELGAQNAETGAILSEGTATVDLDLNRAAQTLTFKLTFSGLGSPITQSHIHFGKVHVAGGVIVFFCAAAGVTAPPGTPSCSGTSGTVTGTITGANVIGPATQNIPAGSFDGLEDALESNTAYGNIHTMKFPAGEIRGQIHSGNRDDDDR